jgi:hypothetical protein
MYRKRFFVPVVVLLSLFLMLGFSLAGASPARAMSSGLASGKVKAPAANLEVEILESNSDFVNYIYLVSPGPALLIGPDNATGTVVSLPGVTPGTELVFEIRVFEPDGVTDTGLRWRSGPPSRNADNERHVQLTNTAGGGIMVAFEDIDGSGWGIADEPNFVDAVFEVRPAP